MKNILILFSVTGMLAVITMKGSLANVSEWSTVTMVSYVLIKEQSIGKMGLDHSHFSSPDWGGAWQPPSPMHEWDTPRPQEAIGNN